MKEVRNFNSEHKEKEREIETLSSSVAMVVWTHVMTSFFPSGYGNADQLLFVFFHIHVPMAAFSLQNSTEPHQPYSQIVTIILINLIISHHLSCVQICFWEIITMLRWCFCLSAVHMFSTGSEQEVICFQWKCHKALDYIGLCISPVLCSSVARRKVTQCSNIQPL